MYLAVDVTIFLYTDKNLVLHMVFVSAGGSLYMSLCLPASVCKCVRFSPLSLDFLYGITSVEREGNTVAECKLGATRTHPNYPKAIRLDWSKRTKASLLVETEEVDKQPPHEGDD